MVTFLLYSLQETTISGFIDIVPEPTQDGIGTRFDDEPEEEENDEEGQSADEDDDIADSSDAEESEEE